MAQIPRLFRSDLTGRMYIVTAYTEQPDGVIVAKVKHDVSDAVNHLLTQERERLVEAVDAAIRLVSPDHITPIGARQIRAAARGKTEEQD